MSQISIFLQNNEHKVLFLPDSSNDLQVPSGDSIFKALMGNDVFGSRRTLAPPTIAASHRPPRIATTALQKASRPEAQAQSIFKLGPANVKTNVLVSFIVRHM